MNIAIICEAVSKKDSLGYEIEHMYRLLSKEHRCRVYAKKKDNPNITYTDKARLERALANSHTAVIYYHSGCWEEGLGLLEKTRVMPIIRYCGIAPKIWFEGYDDRRYYDSLLSRAQTEEIQKRCPDAFWLCSSLAVSHDLKDVPRTRIGVCLPFTEVEERFNGMLPSESVLRQLIESPTFNLLYDGPISPECGIMEMLDILAVYRDLYNSDIVLRLLNSEKDECQKYAEAVRRRISEYHLESNVQFVGKTDASEEAGYYLGCDAMLCCGGYDGYCDTAAKAQYFMLPVLAGTASSAPEALGLNQLSFEDDPRRFAAAIHALRQNGELARTLGRIGKKNFDTRLSLEGIGKTVTAELEKGLWEA